MSRTRGLVRVARCWAHVLRGKGCEGASEVGERHARSERPAGTGVLMLDNNAHFYFLDA